VISVQIDDSALVKVRERLAQLPPRFLRRVYAELRPLLQEALLEKLNDHFAGCGEIGGPTHPTKLTNRTNNLFWSVYRSLKMSEQGTDFTLSIGSNLPYAAIHEFGGYAGRRGPFKKPDGRRPYLRARPYLHPTIDDLAEMLPELLERAVRRAWATQHIEV
jgi:phage gpG-like protein